GGTAHVADRLSLEAGVHTAVAEPLGEGPVGGAIDQQVRLAITVEDRSNDVHGGPRTGGTAHVADQLSLEAGVHTAAAEPLGEGPVGGAIDQQVRRAITVEVGSRYRDVCPRTGGTAHVADRLSLEAGVHTAVAEPLGEGPVGGAIDQQVRLAITV